MTTLDMIHIARRYPQAQDCQVDLLSCVGPDVRLATAVRVQTQAMPTSLAPYAAIILPGFFAQDVASLVVQLHTTWQAAVSRLRTLQPTALVAASCCGTFALAESGLLDGRSATTAWWLQAAFRQRYPGVHQNADRALVDDGNVITAGAMTAHTDLSLHVLRRLFGAELARNVGGIMLVDGARTSQRPFMALQRRFDDPLVQEAADWMAQHGMTALATQDLATALHVSYRTLHRRFSTGAGMPPLAYLQALRVEHAKGLLEDSRMSLDQIVERIGYSDVAAFRRLFARATGTSPAQYRQRFRGAAQGGRAA